MKRIDERGETLVEVVMALGILSLVLVSSYALATGTFRLGRGAGERTQAVNYLQQQAEALRAYRNGTVWSQDFVPTMTRYTATAPKGFFCMTKDDASGTLRWKPVDASAAACTIDGIAITVHPDPVGAGPDQYNYEFTAVWKTGSQENNVRLTTKLTDQTP